MIYKIDANVVLSGDRPHKTCACFATAASSNGNHGSHIFQNTDISTDYQGNNDVETTQSGR